MTIYRSVADTVGNTPLIELSRLCSGLPGRVLGKMESRNPCGSIKDRTGLAMIRDAETRGELTPGATIVEATSGNTGIALAWASAALGYQLVICMPENMSPERAAMLKQFGAEVILTPGGLMQAAVSRAEEECANRPGAVMLQQFKNDANPEVHRRTTAQEILADTRDTIGAFVAGVGTGGTISGVGQVLKREVAGVLVVAVEPEGSAVLSGDAPGQHYIQGIGAGFVPDVFDREVIDEIVAVSETRALEMQQRLASDEGILAGISSGAALAVACDIASRPNLEGRDVVVILPDTGERYLSTQV